MSRVQTLEGLDLTAFDPKSIIVNNSCLEVNRLHFSFRKDLPLYELPVKKKQPIRRNLVDKEAPAKKKSLADIFQSQPPQPKNVKLQLTIKIMKSWQLNTMICNRYYPVNEAWQ